MEINASEDLRNTGTPKHAPRRGLFGTGRDLIFAGIGIAGVLSDEALTLYRRSVERGGATVERARERLKPARGRRSRAARPAGRRTGRSQHKLVEVEAALARLNLPTEADIDALTRQITELEAKINQLNA
jgi:polyhydroxyalkanoate synthesis regulator phasin